MKLLTIIALSSVLSHGTPALQSFSLKGTLSNWLHRSPSVKVLPALDYFYFAA